MSWPQLCFDLFSNFVCSSDVVTIIQGCRVKGKMSDSYSDF